MDTRERDVLDGNWDENAYWSTSNTGEAVPGVLTPLNWSLWRRGGEGGVRRAFVAVGALERANAGVPDDERERLLGLFHGRIAGNVDFMGRMGDRLPATSGAAIAEQLLGRLPDDFVSRPTLRRLPAVLASLPRAFTQAPREVRALRAATAPWWAARVADAAALDLVRAQALWREAAAAFGDAMGVHVTCVFATIQPLYDAVLRTATAAGRPELTQRLLTGLGNHAELLIVEDLWDVSRGRLAIEHFVTRHGYHGPHEGELASRVWREDPAPLDVLLHQFVAKPDAENPAAVLNDRARERREAERELFDALPRPARGPVRFLLDAAARVIPLRGVGKAAFLQTLDVARAAARRIGVLLADDGVIAEVDDVFMLVEDELLSAGPGRRLDELVVARREQRRQHEAVVLPSGWRGRPVVSSVTQTATEAIAAQAGREITARAGLRLTGLGTSPGLVEGRARVILDPAAADVEPGEILVAPFTDPSWAPIMFASAGLVVDIGGELSHAAVVARELGVPCVMGTSSGSRVLRTGDLLRLDGGRGEVTVLRAAE